MNPIRHDLISFIRVWNSHSIRRQANRPHIQPGQPSVLCRSLNSETARNFAEEIPPDRFRFCQETFELDQSDLDAFLPEETMSICQDIITRTIGSLPEISNVVTHPLLDEYNLLRGELALYIQNGNSPRLSLLDRPRDGRDRLSQILQAQNIDIEVFDSWIAAD